MFFSKESLPQLGSDEYHEQIDLDIGDLPISLRYREVVRLAPGELDRLLDYLRRDRSADSGS